MEGSLHYLEKNENPSQDMSVASFLNNDYSYDYDDKSSKLPFKLNTETSIPILFDQNYQQSQFSFLEQPEDNVFISMSSFFSNFSFEDKTTGENYSIIENTLPGRIIHLMQSNGAPLDFDFICNKVKNNIKDFRKANGAKYSDDVEVVVRSTLRSSDMFYKTEGNFFYFKEKECNDFISRTIEREKKKRNKKDIKETKSKTSKKGTIQTANTTKAKKGDISWECNINYRMEKIDRILQDMSSQLMSNTKYAYLKKISKLTNEQLKDIIENDKFLRMLLCIRCFKNLGKNIILYNY